MQKLTNLCKAVKSFFTEKPAGRTILRGLKTFAYTFIAMYVATKTAPFVAPWEAIIETAMLAALGFGADKGLREYLKTPASPEK